MRRGVLRADRGLVNKKERHGNDLFSLCNCELLDVHNICDVLFGGLYRRAKPQDNVAWRSQTLLAPRSPVMPKLPIYGCTVSLIIGILLTIDFQLIQKENRKIAVTRALDDEEAKREKSMEVVLEKVFGTGSRKQ